MSPSACGAGGAHRLAVKAYIDGERLCDEGKVKDGIALLRRVSLLRIQNASSHLPLPRLHALDSRLCQAIDSEPELDNEDWPQWAQSLRSGLEHAERNPPPHATADIDLGGAPASDAQVAALAELFQQRSFIVVDNLIGSDAAQREIAREDYDGRLELSTVYASPSSNAVSVAVPDRRSDRIQYLDLVADAASGQQRQWLAISECVTRMDELVKCLRERLPEELGCIVARQRPMVSAYGEGARFERHCDNHCHEDHEDDEEEGYDPDLGFCANRRRLSAVLYCVPGDWSAADGGALRIYRSTLETGGWEGDDALVDVLPVAGRLVLFASDQRVPHEVLPVTAGRGAVRYALALWFIAEQRYEEAILSEEQRNEVAESSRREKRKEQMGQHQQEERASETSVMAAFD